MKKYSVRDVEGCIALQVWYEEAGLYQFKVKCIENGGTIFMEDVYVDACSYDDVKEVLNDYFYRNYTDSIVVPRLIGESIDINEAIEEKCHENECSLLCELCFDEEEIEFNTNLKNIIKIDEWTVESKEDEEFNLRVFRHEKSGRYLWNRQYPNGERSYDWIELGKGTIQDWIDAVKHREAVIEELP